MMTAGPVFCLSSHLSVFFLTLSSLPLPPFFSSFLSRPGSLTIGEPMEGFEPPTS